MINDLTKEIEKKLKFLEDIFDEDENFEQNEEFLNVFQKVKTDLSELESYHASGYSDNDDRIINSLNKDKLKIENLKKRFNLLKSDYDQIEDEIDYINDIMNPNKEEFEDDF